MEAVYTPQYGILAESVAAGNFHNCLRMRILILGLGNPLVTDDSVGLRVVEDLKPPFG